MYVFLFVQCKIGDKLSIRVGGDFVYDPLPSDAANLLLIGGGVGINPLLSMLQHHTYLLHTTTQNSDKGGRVQLLYSGRSSEELIFKVMWLLFFYIVCIRTLAVLYVQDYIDELVVQSNGLVQVKYFVTQENTSHPQVKGEVFLN